MIVGELPDFPRTLVVYKQSRDNSGGTYKNNVVLPITSIIIRHLDGSHEEVVVPMIDGRAKRLKFTFFPSDPSVSKRSSVYVSYLDKNGITMPFSINPKYIDLYPFADGTENIISFYGVTQYDNNVEFIAEVFYLE